ncbi:MAG: response regulator transcription factor [Clostridia bacterium]|jgi:DNA-binding response OmpR family regulator|nr:response regulator transcription factor [Clostridia bacterium]
MEKKNKILVTDDNSEIREVIKILLQGEGYDVIEASDGKEAIALLDDSVDLIILDIMMPGMDGFRCCAEIRKKSNVPILFLTAKTEDSDKTMGFTLGGDDYLVKPFSYTEMLARVKALLRRYYVYQGKEKNDENSIIDLGGLVIDRKLSSVTVDGKEVALSDLEYNILLLMASHRKKIFSAQNLYESLWNEPYYYTANNTIMVHIRKLRTKIEKDPQNPKYIKTIWGRGYRIE